MLLLHGVHIKEDDLEKVPPAPIFVKALIFLSMCSRTTSYTAKRSNDLILTEYFERTMLLSRVYLGFLLNHNLHFIPIANGNFVFSSSISIHAFFLQISIMVLHRTPSPKPNILNLSVKPLSVLSEWIISASPLNLPLFLFLINRLIKWIFFSFLIVSSLQDSLSLQVSWS